MTPADQADELRTVWRAPKTLLAIFGLATCLALVDGTQTYLWFLALGRPRSLALLLIHHIVYWFTLAVLVPLVLFLAARLRVEWPPRPRALLIHVTAAVTLPLVHIATATLLDPLRLQRGETFQSQFLRWRIDFWATEFLGYWAIAILLYTIEYRRESRRRALAEAQLQANLTEARLQALRAQLNPHFLFNTLNSISVLALKGDHQAVVEMLARLSDLLRVVIDESAPQEIPLAREVDFLDGYLAIQQVRFGERLTVHRHIAADTLDALVPCMILQPIVENAVVHGITEQCGAGIITIETSRDNGVLRLKVSDNGPGFRPDTEGPTGAHVGLSNTRARLEQLYGSQHRIEFGNAEGGASITVSLPFRSSASADRGQA